MLGNNANNKTFLGIREGKIYHKSKDASGNIVEEKFDYVEGTLAGLSIGTPVMVKGQEVAYLKLLIKDGNDLYELSTDSAGSIARSIVLSLANINSFAGETIQINPWATKPDAQGTIHTNVNVRITTNGERFGDRWNRGVKWVIDKFPTDKNQSAALVKGYVEVINSRLNYQPVQQPEPYEDLPEAGDYNNPV